MNAPARVPKEEQEEASCPSKKWEMKVLKPWHMQMCSLLAQGIDRQTIATVLDCTPEYISMLAGQPLVQKHIREMCQYAGLQLEAQFVQSVEAIGDTLANGNYKEKMQAARLQMEATKRIGAGSGIPADTPDMADKLILLSERLVGLLEKQKMANDNNIIEGTIYETYTNSQIPLEGQDGGTNQPA